MTLARRSLILAAGTAALGATVEGAPAATAVRT